MNFWNGQAYKTNHYLDDYDIGCSDEAYEESLKYFKEVEMKFSKNYEKLGWTVFTTIRKNTGKYKLGNTYTMNVERSGKFKARVIGLFPIKKKTLQMSWPQ